MRKFVSVTDKLLSDLRKHWLMVAGAALLVAVSSLSAPAWAGPVAAPLNQTVPPATPTAQISEVSPTATPLPGSVSGNEDESSGTSIEELTQSPEAEAADSVPFTLEEEAEAAEPLTALVTVATLNVREGAGTTFPVIGTLTANQEVTVEARNEDNSWWHVCCLANTDTRGWVSASLLQPNFDRAASAQLIPLFGEARVAQTAPAETEAASAAEEDAAPAARVAAGMPISVTMSYTPTFVWQGKTFDIGVSVTNVNGQPLRNLEFSNEIPRGLILVEARGEGDPTTSSQATENGELVILRWPTLPANATVNAAIRVRVDPDLADGAVIDNLAAVRAANGEYTGTGITIGLPPVGIPDFQ